MTPAEQQLLDELAVSRGWEFVEEFATTIIEQARAMGELLDDE